MSGNQTRRALWTLALRTGRLVHQLADVPRYILYEGVAALELEAEERAAAFQQPPAGSDAFAAVTNLEAKRRRGRLGA